MTGLILPALFAYVYARQYHIFSAFEILQWRGTIATQMCVLSVFPDAALLFVLYTLELWKTAKGVMLAIFPYLLMALWLAF